MSDKFKKIKNVLWIILFANVLVALLKIVIGSKIQSSSMTADGFHSLTDGTSNIIGIIGIGLAVKPKDEDHPYGHKKFETLAGLGIAMMLFFVSATIIKEAFTKFFNPTTPNISAESIIVLVVTLIINIFVTNYESRVGKDLNSDILTADAAHTRSDVFVSIGVLGTLIALKLGLPPIIDPIISLVIAGLIIHTGYEIFKDTASILVDKYVLDNNAVLELLKAFPEVKNVHRIRSRGREDDMFVDLHIMVDGGFTVNEAHALSHNIEENIKKTINENAEVIIHIEPYDGRGYEEDIKRRV
ncbi:MAG: cation transporter [Fusobacteriaceae bacterium]|nr:cation transporter [Fusobacteriaceae bacterium]MBP6468250.1 cation transporter [Fusobacteriaceae bacterium]MBP9596647.1 cation transporter [Fusobacteriaceae bacterium]